MDQKSNRRPVGSLSQLPQPQNSQRHLPRPESNPLSLIPEIMTTPPTPKVRVPYQESFQISGQMPQPRARPGANEPRHQIVTLRHSRLVMKTKKGKRRKVPTVVLQVSMPALPNTGQFLIECRDQDKRMMGQKVSAKDDGSETDGSSLPSLT